MSSKEILPGGKAAVIHCSLQDPVSLTVCHERKVEICFFDRADEERKCFELNVTAQSGRSAKEYIQSCTPEQVELAILGFAPF